MSEQRALGRSPVMVSALGFGGGPIGNLGRAISDAAAFATLEDAWDSGIRYYDTAPLYGHGRSEQRLGDFLRYQTRDSYTLSTKVGRLLQVAGRDDFDRHGFVDTPPLEVAYDYSRDGAMRSIEASLMRLGLDRIDVVLVHDVDRWTHGDGQAERLREALAGALPALLELRRQGIVKAVGIGVNEWEVCQEVAERVDIDCVLLAGRYTLLEREAARSFLPLCRARGIGVIVGGPYNSGILATGADGGGSYNYAPAPRAVLERVRRLEAVLAPYGVPLAAAALQFPLRDPAVAAVIPGLMSPDEVDEAVDHLRHPIPEAAWEELG